MVTRDTMARASAAQLRLPTLLKILPKMSEAISRSDVTSSLA
jgi:hypothetical protein